MHIYQLTILVLNAEVKTLPVYDCDRHVAKFEMISLLGPKQCPDPKRDYRKPETEIVQLLPQKEEAHVKRTNAKRKGPPE